MERERKSKIPWAIALLIVVFACTIAICGAFLINRFANRAGYDYQSVQIAANMGIQATDSGFVYYDGLSLIHI